MMFQDILVAIRDSLSNLANSNDGEDGEDANVEQTEQGPRSEDDKPSWVMGTLCRTVQQRMERFWLNQMKLDELTQPGRKDAAGYFCGNDMKYGKLELNVLAVVNPRTEHDSVRPAPMTFGELMECPHIVPGKSHMPQGTSQPGCIHIGLSSEKPQSNMCIPGLAPATEPQSYFIQNVKPIELVSFDRILQSPQPISIQKSDLNEVMVKAPALLEAQRGKLVSLMSYLS